jgi:hypothetical protein
VSGLRNRWICRQIVTGDEGCAEEGTMRAWSIRKAAIPVFLTLMLEGAIVATALTAPAIAEPAANQVAAIQEFFASIDEGRAKDAIAMMNPDLLPDPETREAWRRQFSVIRSIGLVDVVEVASGVEVACVTYKVTLDVRLDPGAASEPIPYYGWDENLNVRWIMLCPGGNEAWLISSLATGP